MTEPSERSRPSEASEASEASEVDLTSEKRRLVEEKKNERYVWWYLAYFLFGIHIVAFVMIYAVTHAK
ncbi:hypothetical protein SipoB123_10480 [Streptomyces ipomoeae]|nr:hypothetical protein SipoB123_10480 [Streptomyces ipomoeae]